MKNKVEIGLSTKKGSYQSPPRPPSFNIIDILFFQYPVLNMGGGTSVIENNMNVCS